MNEEYSEEDSEKIDELIKAMNESFDSLGLYMNAAMVHSHDPDESLDEQVESGGLFIRAQFRIGEVAWSDRILNPEAFDQEKQFELAAPSEEEIILQRLKDQAASGELFDLDDE
jgi:hypothetical protein